MALNLVTGGCGFIGTHLVELLCRRGEAVRVLDLQAPVEPVAGVDYQQGTITDAAAVERAAEGCRRIFHLAALSGLWGSDKEAFVIVNRTGTQNVLDTGRRKGVETIVHTSTESVLIAMGRGRRPQTVNERTECRLSEMAGAYCRGKYLAEQEARRAADEGRRVVIVNPTIPAGPGDHWITPPTRMMLGFLNGAYPGYLDSTLNLADARDIAEGHWLAAEYGQAGQRYILGAHDIRLGGLLALLGELAGREMVKRRVPYALAYIAGAVNELVADWITHRPPAAPFSGVRLAGVPVTFDNRETRRILGWSPRPLEETLRDAVADYQRRGLLRSPPDPRDDIPSRE